MWKYVSRRIRDTFERSVNHFDKRSSAGVVNSAGNVSDEKSKRSAPPCRWFSSRRCWDSARCESNANNKRWNFEQLNRTWISAITWSGGLVLGWYTSQLLHFKLKHLNRKQDASKRTLLSSLYPYIKTVNKHQFCFDPASQIERVLGRITPTVHLISNDQDGLLSQAGSSESGSTDTSPDASNDDLGDVLNSIENKLGLAAIENGHYQDGLNLLRSAANRRHAPAQYNLGLCYEMGLGVPANENKAMELYRSAAAQEHPGALYNIGVYYGQGRGGLTRNTEMATRLLRLAAVQGQQDAIDALNMLQVDAIQPAEAKEELWEYRCTPFDQHIIPTHTSLFVENVNYFKVPDNRWDMEHSLRQRWEVDL